jgi:hypothetical protein
MSLTNGLKERYEALIEELGKMKAVYNSDKLTLDEFLEENNMTKKELEETFKTKASRARSMSFQVPGANVDTDIGKSSKNWDNIFQKRINDRNTKFNSNPQSAVKEDIFKQKFEFKSDLSYFDSISEPFKTKAAGDLSVFDKIVDDFMGISKKAENRVAENKASRKENIDISKMNFPNNSVRDEFMRVIKDMNKK